MNFQRATKTDLTTVMTWIPDAESCLIWAGPRVRYPLELEQLCEAMEFEKTRTYSLYGEGELLALGQIRMFDNLRGHLSRVVVKPSERGKGVGRIFMEALISEAKKLNCQTISLHVVKVNAVAIHLYKKLGFITPSEPPYDLREGIIYMELG